MGTEVKWFDGGSSTTEKEILLDALTANRYSVGEQFDLQSIIDPFVPYVFAWRIKIDFAASTPGESVQIYAAAARSSTPSAVDGGFTTSTHNNQTDHDRLNNLKHIGNAYSDDQSGHTIYGSGQFVWWERYFSPVILNATENNTFDSEGDNIFIIEELVKA